ncbi:SNF2-related protein [Corynebacterium mendelii]|uniref:ATP-dependent helicase n=1 Tax=Corynebacterium mendelii TaxID=2765362 RepID=A0A939DYY3_9CORY|nr:SNF2-related protein [Corynebacterium mendelii]MBN9643394.1 ATP-dependent helicase [Corynebacterium mendelii]
MDKAEFDRIISRADTVIGHAATITGAVAALSRPPAAPLVTGAGIVPAPGSGDRATPGPRVPGALIITPHTVKWPDDLYARAAADDCGGLADFPEFAARVETLRFHRDNAVAAAAGGSFLRSLFSRTVSPAAAAAAGRLRSHLDDPVLAALSARCGEIGHAVRRAAAEQRRGVHVAPGIHGQPDSWTTTARYRLAEAAGMQGTVTVTSLPVTDLPAVIARITRLKQDPDSPGNLARLARQAVAELTRERAAQLLSGMAVDVLAKTSPHRLRLAGLDTIGVTTVNDVLARTTAELMAVDGIGEKTARRILAAARTLDHEARASCHRLSIGHTPTAAAQQLVAVAARYAAVADTDPVVTARRARLVEVLAGVPAPHGSTTSWDVLVSDRAAWDSFTEDLAWAIVDPRVLSPGRTAGRVTDPWQDYQADPARYHALVAQLINLDHDSVGGREHHLDDSTVEKIRALQLDTSRLRGLSLRGYQSFGARFAVVGGKTILGDEMGLGKTIQALAVASHIAARGPWLDGPVCFCGADTGGDDSDTADDTDDTDDSGNAAPGQSWTPPAASATGAAPARPARILVICPASVLVNWLHETDTHTDFPVWRLHGPARQANHAAWISRGGVAVTTFGTARVMRLAVPDFLIVDEAHFIKNPRAQRSRAAAALITAAPTVMLLSGTPMENRVDEFVTLVGYVSPGLVTEAMAGLPADVFATRIAPVYLRRNVDEVLDELPEKTEETEWVELTAADQEIYARAVKEGNWMLMRRAAWLTDRGIPAKLARLDEIVAQAATDGSKVLVFSFFREVIDVIAAHLGQVVCGVIDGSVTPSRRQELVDGLAAAPAGSVLVSQITAGGQGLNIQSADVVVLAEPQVKPTVEEQAIARSYRMGQTRPVHVYRLIGDDTVDERMLVILKGKKTLFDSFARDSAAADVADAVDISEKAMAEAIIAAERQRLGFAAGSG